MFKHTNAFSSFSCNNLEAAAQFYATVLEMEVRTDDMGILELYINGRVHTIIYPKPNHEPATFTVLNFPVENIETAVDALAAKGVVFEQYEGDIRTNEKGICDTGNGPRIAWFKDPAGNILSVLENNML